MRESERIVWLFLENVGVDEGLNNTSGVSIVF